MLTTLAQVKNSMQIPSGDTTNDNFLSALIPAVDLAIKNWLGRNVERVAAVVAPVQAPAALAAGGSLVSGQAYYWVVTAINPNGETTASNEKTLTPSGGNLSGSLTWAASVVAAGYNVYRGTTPGGENLLVAQLSYFVTSFLDTGIVGTTVSPPASNTARAGLTEYLNGTNTHHVRLRETPLTARDITAVYMDPSGLWGGGTDAFDPTTTLQIPGQDYVMPPDQPDGVTSKSGLLRRIANVWPGSWERRQGRLATESVMGLGNIKVVYNGGFNVVPYDLAQAANLMVAKMFAMGPTGFINTSESFEDRSVSIDLGAWGSTLFQPDVVSILLNYRKLRA